MGIILIGDVHGETLEYQELILDNHLHDRTIQIGDMALGFKGVRLGEMPTNHRWFRGNHDDPAVCRAHPNYLGDWGFLKEDSVFYIAGGFSIDRMYRTIGISWWADEELSWQELQKAIDLYKEVKPRFVISHEAPSEAAQYMLNVAVPGFRPEKLSCTLSRTAEAMQVMLDLHRPEEWVFGHYHVDKTFHWKGTKFSCVAPMHRYLLETDRPPVTGMTITSTPSP